MAKGVSGLFISLGLSLDQLETDFIAAEKTTRENIARLNRESNLIKLRAEVEAGKLDATADAVQILTIKENALNEQMAIQRDKIKLAEAALAEMNQKHGETSAVSQKAAAALERERLTLQRLANELQNVQNAKISSPDTKTDTSTQNTNKLLERYQNLKGVVGGKIGKLAEEFNGLKSAAGSADGAITKSLEIIGRIPHPAGKAVAAIAAIPLAMHGIENSIINLAKPAIAAGDSFYVMSRGVQMSIKDTAKLSMICKVTGVEISEVISMSKRLTSQFAKADSKSPMMKMLGKYGVQVRDLNGDIKNTLDLSLALSEGLKKAQAEGRGREFIGTVIGRSASGDIITYLEDLEANVEQAKKVVKNGLSDPVRAHALQGELNTLEAQTGQLKSAFSSAFMPVAEVLIPKTTARMGELTKVIADNADGIKTLGLSAATALGALEDVAGAVMSGLITTVGTFGREITPKTKSMVDRYATDSKVNSAKDLLERELQRKYNAAEILSIQNNPLLYQQIAAPFEGYYQAIEEARKKMGQSWADFKRDCQNGVREASRVTEEELQASADRIEKYAEELAHINIDLEFGADSYKKSVAELDLWHKKALEQAEKFEDEKTKLSELYNAKREQIERRHNKEVEKIQKENQSRVQEHLNSAASIEYGLTHSAFEKQLYDIERWKDAQLEKSKTAEETAAIIADAAAKEADAFQREMDRIQGRIESAQDRLMRLTSSGKDYDLYRAQKQYLQDLKDRIPQGLAQAIYAATVKDIQYRAATDKGGSYNKSKNRRSNSNPYIIEFNQQPNQQPDWAHMDSRLLAQESLQQTNQQLANSAQNLISAQNNLIKSTNETAQGFEIIEGDRVVTSMQNFVEAQNSFTQSANAAAQGFEIIEGDKIITSINNSAQSVIDAQNNLIAANTQAAQNALKTVPTIPKIEPPKIEIENNFSAIQNKFSEMTAGLDKAMTDIQSKSETFLISMETISKNGDLVSVSLQNTAAALDETNKKILEFFLPKYSADINSTSNYQQEKFTNFIPDINPTAQIQSTGINLEPLMIEVQSIRTKIEILSDTATKIYDLKNFPQEQTSIGETQNYNLSVEPLIVEVQAIRNHVEKVPPQKPNITIAPNINIDLGGAYVFDDAMKRTLTEDVTNEVVIAVKDSFQQAKDTASYDYAN